MVEELAVEECLRELEEFSGGRLFKEVDSPWAIGDTIRVLTPYGCTLQGMGDRDERIRRVYEETFPDRSAA